MKEKEIAALFVRRDSVYKMFPEVDCYDINRDARTFSGGMPVICHPPCRTWGKYAYRSKAPEGEHELAEWAVKQVCKWGGVLEHPVGSSLKFDPFIAGMHSYFLELNQSYFGYMALKPTKIYIISKSDISERQVRRFNGYGDVVRTKFSDLESLRYLRGTRKLKPLEKLSKKQREATPIAFAQFLIDIAKMCG
jgi:hypothetical protein